MCVITERCCIGLTVGEAVFVTVTNKFMVSYAVQSALLLPCNGLQ